MIAHRLSTVAGADRIFVLEKGALVEAGDHDELVAEVGSVYRRLVDAQLMTGTPTAARRASQRD